MSNGLQRLFNRVARPQPGETTIVSAFGRKGSGKTTLNRVLYQASPRPKLCLDVNGNADPGVDAQPIGDLERKMPIPRNDEDPIPNLHWIANPSADTYQEDLDRGVRMALFPKEEDTLVWIGEVGEFCTGNRTGPSLRLLLQQMRHYHTSALFDGPRPMDIDPLVLSQSDYVAVFSLPNPRDRERVANAIGVNPREFSSYCDDVFARSKHHFLLFEAEPVDGDDQLIACEPIPIPKEPAHG